MSEQASGRAGERAKSRLFRLLACSPVLLFAYCATVPLDSADYRLLPQVSGSSASFRGVSVIDANTAWASGSRGTVLLTTDAGNNWTAHKVPQADSLDFRDIAAFDAMTAYVLSAGEDGRIYKTSDGGTTWTLQFK